MVQKTKSYRQKWIKEKEKNKALSAEMEKVLTTTAEIRVSDSKSGGNGNGHNGGTQPVAVAPAIPLPPQPMPSKKSWYSRPQKVALVNAIVIKPTGLYFEKVKESELPPDARLWEFADNYVYSLIEYTGEWLEQTGHRYDIFEPTGESQQLPEKLWRAVRALPIRAVFAYKNNKHKLLNMGLGIAFVITCMVVLFIIANVFFGGG